MYFLAWGLMAFILYPPIGPVGFTAGEHMLRGQRRSFVRMALGVLIADLVISALLLLMVKYLPHDPDGHMAQNAQWLWVMVGSILLYIGFRAWSRPPVKADDKVEDPFRYGLRWTLLLPANYAGVLAVFGAAYAAGTIPSETLDRLIMALTLGVVAGLLWAAWGVACYTLSRQKTVSIAVLGRVFQKLMAGSICLIAVTLMLKPFQILPF